MVYLIGTTLLPMTSVVFNSLKQRKCHSERSEESRFLKVLRPFALFRVTRERHFSTVFEGFTFIGYFFWREAVYPP